jgi:hypothetical protein
MVMCGLSYIGVRLIRLLLEFCSYESKGVWIERFNCKVQDNVVDGL